MRIYAKKYLSIYQNGSELKSFIDTKDISALEMALKDEGYPVELGSGVRAAELVLRKGK